MGRFSIVTLTEAAAARVRALVAGGGEDALGIRVGVKKGGCAGMEYTVDLVRGAAHPKDDVVEVGGGARLFVDPAATLFLLGTKVDYETTKLRSGFVFRNPNETSACGCGESVELKAADPTALQAAG